MKNRNLTHHPLIVALFTTCLMASAGAAVTHMYQLKAIEHTQELVLYKAKIDDTYSLLDELLKSISLRTFGLKRVIWAVKDPESNAQAVWKDYYESTRAWNEELLYYTYRLTRSLVASTIPLLINKADYYDPRTLHGAFLQAHATIHRLKNCKYESCDEVTMKKLIDESEQQLDELYVAVKKFSDACVITLPNVGHTS